MHRNLSYMKGRCTRINKNRSNFKVDSILESKMQKNQMNEEPRFKFMTLTFLGFFDSKGWELLALRFCAYLLIHIIEYQLPKVKNQLMSRLSLLKLVTKKEKMYLLLLCK